MGSKVTVSVAGKLMYLSPSTSAPRFRTRHQPESHRTPRYRVRYQLENQPVHEAVVGRNPPQYLVARIRESSPGDLVEVTLSGDHQRFVDWRNATEERLWEDFSGTWDESE